MDATEHPGHQLTVVANVYTFSVHFWRRCVWIWLRVYLCVTICHNTSISSCVCAFCMVLKIQYFDYSSASTYRSAKKIVSVRIFALNCLSKKVVNVRENDRQQVEWDSEWGVWKKRTPVIGFRVLINGYCFRRILQFNSSKFLYSFLPIAVYICKLSMNN